MLVVSRPSRPIPARAWRVGSVALCARTVFLIARLAVGESIALASYESWQGNGLARSGRASAVPVVSSATISFLSLGKGHNRNACASRGGVG